MANELSEFIQTTLVGVVLGVEGANDQLRTSGGGANYFVLSRSLHTGDKKVSGISFDIALAAERNQKDKAGFFVTIATMSGGANTAKGNAASATHRIQFEVAVNWDHTIDRPTELKKAAV